MPASEPPSPLSAEASSAAVSGDATSPAVSPVPPRPMVPPAQISHAFVRELQELVDRYDKEGVTLGALLDRTDRRGYYLLLILISLPFVTPIPLPGFSIPFGAATVFGSRAPPLTAVRWNLAIQKTRVGQLAVKMLRNLGGKPKNTSSKPSHL